MTHRDINQKGPFQFFLYCVIETVRDLILKGWVSSSYSTPSLRTVYSRVVAIFAIVKIRRQFPIMYKETDFWLRRRWWDEWRNIPCTWKGLMGKFYYCDISIVRRQIKNPWTSRKRTFNFVILDVLILCSVTFRRWCDIIWRFKAEEILRFS